MQHDGVMADVRKLDYNFNQRTGRLYLSALNYADMGGCLAVFKAIDPKVRKILTFAASRPDTVYLLEKGEWRVV